MRPVRKSVPSRSLPRIILAAGVLWGAAAWVSAPLLTGCAALMDAAKQRLALLGVGFDVKTVDVSRLAYPSNLLDVASLGRYGVDVRVGIRAKNAKPYQAVFDGAAAKLRVRDTGPSDPAASGSIPSFNVPANGETVFDVTFPLRLDSPVFGKQVWMDILRGRKIKYAVDAELPLRFPEGVAPAGVENVQMRVVSSEVDSKAAAGAALDRLLDLVAKVL